MAGYEMVSDNVALVRERIAAAAIRSGRRPDEISLLAVSKFHPIEAVDAAWAAGLRLFGENRVQEAESKFGDRSERLPGARLEFVGSLQSNKAKRACALFDAVQSVDSEDLLRELDSRAKALGRRLDILFELHTAEDSKAGLLGLDALLRACELAAELGATANSPGPGGLDPRGLMTMAPFTDDETAVRSSFRALREALSAVQARFAFPGFETLSMGMTGDFETAIEEGSTLVRIGTAIFGERGRP
jgi:hypothetical protein